jgi:formiminotetrahydrofolate cyclodeaminase
MFQALRLDELGQMEVRLRGGFGIQTPENVAVLSQEKYKLIQKWSKRSKIMKMTNSDIYVNATQLVAAFENYKQVLPIKINFYLQKNKQTLTTLANDIENSRLEIIRTHGILSDDGEYYTIPEEKRDFV